MNILILLVIAMFIVTAAYVGYHASQNQSVEEVIGHNMEFKILSLGSDSISTMQNLKPDKSII